MQYSNDHLQAKNQHTDPVMRAKAISKINDYRIHAVLWVVGSKQTTECELDLIRTYLQPICNVIPVITKADHYSQKELAEFRTALLSQAS